MHSNHAQRALEHFVIDRKIYDIIPVHQGYINDTFRVIDEGIPKYILQKINTTVFQNVPSLMQNLQRLLPFLEHAAYTSLELMPTKARLPFYLDDYGHYWRLMTHVQDCTSYNFTEDTSVAFEVGKIIGLFHTLLENAPTNDFQDTLPQFHNLEKRLEEFYAAQKKASTERMKKAENAIRFALATLPEVTLTTNTDIPVRICHNDTKLNNILFSKTTGKALCLIDLDTVMKGYFHFDFGDAVRTVVNPAPEDEQQLDAIDFNIAIFEAVVQGLKTSGLILSKREIELLSYGPVLMPYLHGIRALTDYLNNDIYYKVAFPEQNLQRSKSLFEFTRKALLAKASMETIVKELLGTQ